MFITQENRRGKAVSESAIEGFRIELLSEKSNPSGIFYGGRILEMVDKLALEVAKRHSEKSCITQGVDFVRFLSPARKGEILICSASVNRAWRFTMEVGVKVITEDFRLLEKRDILLAYFTFVAIDENQQPTEIPYLITETEVQKKLYREAEKRRRFSHSQIRIVERRTCITKSADSN